MLAWINRIWQEETEIKVAITASLFKTLSGVFTTILIYDGRPIWFDKHIDRILNSALTLGFIPVITRQELTEALLAWPQVNKVDQGLARIFIWRADEDVLAMVAGEQMPVNPRISWRLGYAQTIRSRHDITVQHKTISRLTLEWEYRLGLARGWDDVVFCNEHGEVTETSRGNLFWYQQGTVYTPHTDCGLLPGVGRQQVMTACQQLDYPLYCGRFQPEHLNGAEGVLAVNSLRGIIPIMALGEKSFAGDHPLLAALQRQWWKLVKNCEK